MPIGTLFRRCNSSYFPYNRESLLISMKDRWGTESTIVSLCKKIFRKAKMPQSIDAFSYLALEIILIGQSIVKRHMVNKGREGCDMQHRSPAGIKPVTWLCGMRWNRQWLLRRSDGTVPHYQLFYFWYLGCNWCWKCHWFIHQLFSRLIDKSFVTCQEIVESAQVDIFKCHFLFQPKTQW